MSMEESPVVDLARRQLDAYNNADLDAFCACYSEDVRVLDEAGTPTTEGMEAFRAGYAGLFSRFRGVHASVSERLALGRHVVEREAWQREDGETGEGQSGEVLVRYTERDGLIALVQFLHGP